MCLIIAKKGAIETPIPEDYIRNAASNNPHGFGIVGMPPPVKDMPVVPPKAIKTMNMDEALMYIRQYEALHWDFIAHFRYATAGNKDLENCHPFEIGPDTYLAHNGVIAIGRRDVQYSDTWEWTQQMKAFVEKGSPSLVPLNRKNIRHFFGRIPNNRNLTKNSKFAVIGKDVPLTVINPKNGEYIDGIWYSNPRTARFGQRSWQRGWVGGYESVGPDLKALRTATEFKDDAVLLGLNRRLNWLSNDIELGTATPWQLTGILRNDFMLYFNRFPMEIADIFSKAALRQVRSNEYTKEQAERRELQSSLGRTHQKWCRCTDCKYKEQEKGVTKEINFTTSAGTRVKATVNAEAAETNGNGVKVVQMKPPLAYVEPKSLWSLIEIEAIVEAQIGREEVCH